MPKQKAVASRKAKMLEYYKKYQELCRKYGFRIEVTPSFQPTNHGTWEIVLQASVGKLPKDGRI